MIAINKSATADTRTCDYANTSKVVLLASSCQHIGDVCKAIELFKNMLEHAAVVHDTDKISGLDWFHEDFITGFKETGWWDNHRKISRHHLDHPDGIPKDVNLIDVLEYIADCVMAGMARSGDVYELKLDEDVLWSAFNNTIILLKKQVEVKQ